MFFNHLTKPIADYACDRLRERKIMTDTSLVQGEFAPADTSFAADLSVQSSPLDAVHWPSVGSSTLLVTVVKTP